MAPTHRNPLLTSFAERSLQPQLAKIATGRLKIQDGGRIKGYGFGLPEIAVTVLDRRFYPAVAFGGAVGAGESYAEGWWTTEDLTGLVRLLIRNRNVVDGLETGWARLVQPLRRLLHAWNRNTRRGSQRNIRAHYDLSNEFFELFLDETLTYSCGVFDGPGATLRDASIAKYDRLATLLNLRPGDRVVEIGTGWGGFAIRAATEFGCRVTTTTISDEQFRFASRRVAEIGLADQVTVVQRDYRDLTGRFDKLVSIEMIEAVGHEHYDMFFAKCADLLEPDGLVAIQAITIQDDRYHSARREVDFIKRHIFPGSCIPSRAVLARSAERAGLTLLRDDEIGLHYAETLRRWRTAFFANRDRVAALGFDERFQRLWDFYFCYCEAGFLEGAIGTAQLSFARQTSTAGVLQLPSPPSLSAPRGEAADVFAEAVG